MKNIILKVITYFMLIMWFLSAFSLDSGTMIPTATLIISSMWLIPYGIKNNWFECGYER